VRDFVESLLAEIWVLTEKELVAMELWDKERERRKAERQARNEAVAAEFQSFGREIDDVPKPTVWEDDDFLEDLRLPSESEEASSSASGSDDRGPEPEIQRSRFFRKRS
jgi:hypothetical protein